VTLVLVTGGAGFIGSHTVDLLLDRGYDVRILDSLQPRVHPNGLPPWVPGDAQFIQGDVADADTLAQALAGVDFVVHLAAYQDYMTDFSQFLHTNAESMALLFELIVSDRRAFPVRKLVFASSQSVAGEGTYRCLAEGRVFHPEPRRMEALERGVWDIACDRCGSETTNELIDETCTSPHTAYAISKTTSEMLASALGRRYGVPTAGLRYTYVQGPRNSPHNPYSGIARRFAMLLRSGRAPICYEDGRQLRDYVNVYDVAKANVMVMEAPDATGVFNVGGGRGVSVLEFARMMIRESAADLEPEVPGLFRVGDTRHTVSSLDRIRSLGWAPALCVEENVRQFLTWFDEHGPPTSGLEEAERVMVEQGVVRRAAVG
jgi:dTDP-L-rhamnose 4-epimerase